MLGRNRHSKCGWDRCRFCQDGSEVRRFKRKEQRQVAKEVAEGLAERGERAGQTSVTAPYLRFAAPESQ